MMSNKQKSSDALRASLQQASASKLSSDSITVTSERVSHNSQGTDMKKARSSRKTVIGEKVRQMALFANNIAMEDEDELVSNKEDVGMFGNAAYADEGEYSGETGAQRLQRALTTETKQKGLFRYTNALGTAVGIEPDVLMRVALEDEWQMVSCASLPFTIVFFVIFMMFFQLHYGVTDIYLAEAALRDKLGNPATELNEAHDIYKWLENEYFTFLWAARPDANFNQQLTSPSLYQELIAGVRISTTLSERQKCQDDLVNTLDCYNVFTDTTMSKNGIFGRRLRGNETELVMVEERLREQRLVDEAVKNAKKIDGNAKELPEWAKPGLSESWQKYLDRKAEFHLELRPRKRTAEARDWSEQSSPSFRDHRKRTHSMLYPACSLSKPLYSEFVPGGRKAERRTSVRDNYLRRLEINRPEFRPLTPRYTDGNTSRIIIPSSFSLPQALAEVSRWRTNEVIAATTMTFSTEALVLNKNLGHELLSSVTIHFSIHRGGSVFTEVKIVSLIFTSVTSEMIQLGIGLLWLFCLVSFSLMLPSRAFMRWRQGKLRSHFLRFWNLLEWGIILWGWMVLVLFVIERSQTMALKSDIEDYQSMRATTPASDLDATDEAALASFLNTSTDLTELSMWCQMFVALYHIILVCRFFLASRGQPRLAVVLSTIRKASIDLGHLFIVFMIIFIAYAISGHILFGRRMQEFATFQGAFARCFQIVMEREYTWAEFTEEDLWTATVWIWSFLLLVVLVLVNIFLAMIFDTYGDVRSSVGSSATLWQTTKIVLTHLRHTLSIGDATTRWVSNRELVQAIKSMQCQYVTPWMVKDAFPGISNRQVNYVFNLGKNRLETMLLRGNKSSLPAVIASVLLGVERITQGLQMMQGNASAAVAQQAEKAEVGASEGATKEDQKNMARKASLLPPPSPPPWLKVQLLPHFQKQKNLLIQAHAQIQRIEKTMQQRGLRNDLNPPPGTTRSTKAHSALGAPCMTLLPNGPSNGTTAVGMLPAALRAGLTASSGDRPLAEPMSLRQPGG